MEKRITITDISRRLNVSPTTVTKALNGKPKISEAMREEVIKVAAEMNYKPNKSAKALSRNELTIGIVYPKEPNEFYSLVEKGLKNESDNLIDYKVNSLFYPVDGLSNAFDIREALIELKNRGIDGLVLSPGFKDIEYQDVLEELTISKTPIVYLVNEVDKKPGLGCVCMDGILAGRMAAQFLGFCLREKRNVVVFSCNNDIRVQRDCIKGFIEESKSQNVNLKGVFETQDDKKTAYLLMENVLADMPDVNGVYVSSYNTAAVCKCLADHKKTQDVKVIGQDVFDEMIPYMENGIQQATLYQNPCEQGKRAVRILYKRLIKEEVPESYFYITPQIVFTSNLSAYINKEA